MNTVAPALNATESKVLTLLGQGFAPEMVATAVGVTPARISQLLSQDEFAQQVAELRYKQLAAHTERDSKYDTLEDQILERLRTSLSMVFDPMKLAKLLSVVNSAKRRGAAAPEHLTTQQTVVQLNIPTAILQQFTTNINNQVVKAGQQDLITVQSANMTALLTKMQPQLLIQPSTGEQNVPSTQPRIAETAAPT
jgi:ABC-type histidine transport system ATPase subunit